MAGIYQMRAAKNGKHERVEELLQDKAAPNTTEIDAVSTGLSHYLKTFTLTPIILSFNGLL